MKGQLVLCSWDLSRSVEYQGVSYLWGNIFKFGLRGPQEDRYATFKFFYVQLMIYFSHFLAVKWVKSALCSVIQTILYFESSQSQLVRLTKVLLYQYNYFVSFNYERKSYCMLFLVNFICMKFCFRLPPNSLMKSLTIWESLCQSHWN